MLNSKDTMHFTCKIESNPGLLVEESFDMDTRRSCKDGESDGSCASVNFQSAASHSDTARLNAQV